MTVADLRHLRWHLLLAVALVAAGAILAVFAHQARQSAHAELTKAGAAYQAAHQRLRQAQADESITRETLSRFQALQARGLVGAEQRLEWVEGLRNLQRQLALATVDYELRPRQLLPGEGAYRLATSTLALKVELLHEEDLLALLDGLTREPTALVSPLHCRMTLARGEAGTYPRLTAECDLEWLTIAQEATP